MSRLQRRHGARNRSLEQTGLPQNTHAAVLIGVPVYARVRVCLSVCTCVGVLVYAKVCVCVLKHTCVCIRKRKREAYRFYHRKSPSSVLT